MALKEVYDYFRHYDKETYQVVACMGNEPSEEDVQDFENQYGIRLPEDFREFTMSSLGGLFMEVREELWPRAKAIRRSPVLDLLPRYQGLGDCKWHPRLLRHSS